MRLPSLVTVLLGTASLLASSVALAEPTRSYPLPEPSAAPEPSSQSFAPRAATQSPAPQAPAAAPPPANYYSGYAYPQGSSGSGYTDYSASSYSGQPTQQWQQAPAQGPVADQPGATPEPDDAKRGPSSVSISLSLLHLIGPLAEGTLELRPFDHVGIAGVLGRGNFTVDGTDYTVWEYGGQLNIYSSAFDGLAITGEVFRFSGEGEPEPGVKGSGRGTLLSGLIGYKGITTAGFTLIIQGGFTRVLAEVTAEHPQLGSASEDASTWLPMANLNLGWTL
ncbi:MAG: hypothetical protein H6718_10955 [Polyangiaceae bacterium]|nr:hypothetical protein [Polyangiaceae bacterium]MCB9607163.1 hypothetical protein [Polyangiaceae bacterium]